jgi:hypothetical protein
MLFSYFLATNFERQSGIAERRKIRSWEENLAPSA